MKNWGSPTQKNTGLSDCSLFENTKKICKGAGFWKYG